MIFDGRPVSPAGAAFAGAFTIDSIDGHDTTSPCKGHAGSAVFPALLAVADSLRASGAAISGEELMVALAVAYEIAYRAGLTLHGTVLRLPHIRGVDRGRRGGRCFPPARP